MTQIPGGFLPGTIEYSPSVRGWNFLSLSSWCRQWPAGARERRHLLEPPRAPGWHGTGAVSEVKAMCLSAEELRELKHQGTTFSGLLFLKVAFKRELL